MGFPKNYVSMSLHNTARDIINSAKRLFGLSQSELIKKAINEFVDKHLGEENGMEKPK